MALQTTAVVTPVARVQGRVRVPGDKSVSHRYALLGALAEGTSRFDGFSAGADAAATLACLRGLGVTVRDDADDRGNRRVEVTGRSLRGLARPPGLLDAANSGTTIRLLAGVLAAHPFETTITGDASLRRRPMRRVIDPLERMGARIQAVEGRPPLTIHGGDLTTIDYETAVPSAQVKSAVLLAGLHVPGVTVVREAAPTRDHTERALAAFGLAVRYGPGWATVDGARTPRALCAQVPGDPSAAAFWAVAAAALPGSDVEIVDVGLNPTRLAFLDILRRAGARVETDLERLEAGEPVGRIRVRHDRVDPITVDPSEVPGLIDELPVLAVLGALGGSVSVSGAGELRVKESDRIRALVSGLRALGAEAEERPDGFRVGGRRRPRGGIADAAGDHRLAMALAIAALGAEAPCTITAADSVTISYPRFFDTLRELTA